MMRLLPSIIVIASALLLAARQQDSELSASRQTLLLEQGKPVINDEIGNALAAARSEREVEFRANEASDLERMKTDFAVQSQERREAELKAERTLWREERLTPCASTGSADKPEICIVPLGPTKLTFGQRVPLRIRWRNLPHAAHIRLFVRNAAPAGERWQYAGSNGAILPDFRASTSSGTATLVWDGKSTWCAPGDMPMLCDTGEVGSFVIRAAILSGTDPFWPSWPDRRPTPTRWLALDETPPIELTGDIRAFRNLGRSSFGPINDSPLRRLVPASYLMQGRMSDAEVGPLLRSRGDYCATVTLAAPFAGKPQLCFPASRRDEFGLKIRPWDIEPRGQVSMAKGIMPPWQARERAQRAAFKSIRGHARYIVRPKIDESRMTEDDKRKITWARQEQVYAYYNSGPAPYWLVTLNQSVNTLNYEEYISPMERLAYRVEMDGTVCAAKGKEPEQTQPCPKPTAPKSTPTRS